MTKNKYFLCFLGFMKKWLVVLLVLLIGCTSPSTVIQENSYCAEGYELVNGGCRELNSQEEIPMEEAPVEEPEELVPEPVTTEVSEPELIPAPVQEPLTPAPVVNQTSEFAVGFKEVEKTNPLELLSDLFQKVKSYGYNIENDNYAVVGSNSRVFMSKIKNIDDNRINSIYFDSKSKTAIGKCIPDRYFVKRGLHTQCDELGEEKYTLDYSAHYQKTPEEYLRQFSAKVPADIIEGQRIKTRDAYLFIFRNGDDYQNFWADSTYGLPLRIEWYEGSERIKSVEFDDIILNEYTLEEVTA